MKVGFSFGRCIRDIVNGDVNIEDVAVIIAQTRMESLDAVTSVTYDYMSRRNYLLGLDEVKCMDVATKLYKAGRIHQPRLFDYYAGQLIREDFVWMDLVPTASNVSGPVQDAWENYQLMLRLCSDNVPSEKDTPKLKRIEHE